MSLRLPLEGNIIKDGYNEKVDEYRAVTKLERLDCRFAI